MQPRAHTCTHTIHPSMLLALQTVLVEQWSDTGQGEVAVVWGQLPGLSGQNADDREDPGNEMSHGNGNAGQTEVACVSASCGLLGQFNLLRATRSHSGWVDLRAASEVICVLLLICLLLLLCLLTLVHRLPDNKFPFIPVHGLASPVITRVNLLKSLNSRSFHLRF